MHPLHFKCHAPRPTKCLALTTEYMQVVFLWTLCMKDRKYDKLHVWSKNHSGCLETLCHVRGPLRNKMATLGVCSDIDPSADPVPDQTMLPSGGSRNGAIGGAVGWRGGRGRGQPTHQQGGMGERCKLLHRGLGPGAEPQKLSLQSR